LGIFEGDLSYKIEGIARFLALVLCPTLPPSEAAPLKLSFPRPMVAKSPNIIGSLRESKRGFAPLFYYFPLSKSGEGDKGGEVDK